MRWSNKDLLSRLTLWTIPFLLSLATILISNLPAYNQQIKGFCRPQIVLPESADVDVAKLATNCADPKNIMTSRAVALSELAKADVVYLGENHDSAAEHQTQLEIIQQLQGRNPKIAIALEMFQRPYQAIIDRYLAGQLNEQQLLEQTEYKQRWGFPWEYYAPILRFAKEKQLPVLALNTPTEVTRQVAREGLESLTQEQRQFIPPFSEIRTDNAEYRQLLLTAFKQHQHSGHGSSSDFDRFFLAQVLWDETMAERIAHFLEANPNHQVVVLAGAGHIIYGYGIPSRVSRRLQNKQLVQRLVLLSNPQESVSIEKPISDFIWQNG